MARKKKIDFGFTPSEYQEKIFDFISNGVGNAVISASAGSGKCLGKDTEILMFDGSFKKVQDIKIGDKLMGDDSTPRTVLSTTKGIGKLKKIVPKKGESWVCNDVHILTLAKYRKGWGKRKSEHITIDIPINELENGINISNNKHHDGDFRIVKLLKTGVDFKEQPIDFDPWLYGIWLGDGTIGQSNITNVDNQIIENISKVIPSNLIIDAYKYKNGVPKIIIKSLYGVKRNTNDFRQFVRNESVNDNNEKIINKKYLINSRENRLKLLAGIIDSDGYYCRNNYYISTKFKCLCDDILFLARSLGLGAYATKRNKICHNNGVTKPYYHITINGNLQEIPVILDRKKADSRKIVKNPLHVGFRIEDYGIGDYYGFTLDGNGRFLLSDFTITHNTSTIISSMKLIPKKQKCLFIAFNKSIADELTKKLEGLTNVQVKTSHSLGFLMLRRNLGNETELDEYKYKTYIKSNISKLTSVGELIQTRQQLTDYINSIIELVNFARFNYCQSTKEIEKVAIKYSIPIQYDECNIVLEVLKWGKENTKTIDYTDMVWLPVELNFKPLGLQYDWIMVDECQDISIVALKLIQKCFKRGTRSVFVGDASQAIYAFCGGDEDSFKKICEQANTQIFDLPISYRCDKNIIKLANTIVPTIKSRDDADEGIIIDNCKINALQDNDMILCRSKAPLVKLYTKLLQKKKNCFIKGQDIGSNLIQILSNIDADELNSDLNKNGVFIQLYKKMFNDRNKLMQKRNLDYDDATLSSSIMEQYDNINTLLILSKNFQFKDELIAHIKSIFKEEENGICLSTIHKAKGLEANNVYILCRSTMPSKLAQLEWEKKQEENLVYVAYTRAKHKLGFISEKEIAPCGSSQDPMIIINELMYIENKICKILGVEPTVRMSNVDIAKFNLKNSTKIEEETKQVNVIKSHNDKNKDEDLLKYLDSLIK